MDDHFGPSERLDRRNKYIALIILCAFVVAYESVAVEIALKAVNLDVFIVSAVPSLMGGLFVLAFTRRKAVDFITKSSRSQHLLFIGATVTAAFGVLLWYDAVGIIGASKEAILGGGSSEVLFVVILSIILLGERLRKWEVIGGVLILVGVFLVLVRADTFALSLGRGETEAIISSFLLAVSAVLTTKLLLDTEVLAMSGLALFIEGIIIFLAGALFFPVILPDVFGWIVLILLGLFPAVAITTYCASLQGIGASLTSILFALSGMLTIIAQLSVLAFFDVDLELPDPLALAVIGGILAFIGIFLIHRNTGAENNKD